MLPSDMRTRNLKKHPCFSVFMSFENRLGSEKLSGNFMGTRKILRLTSYRWNEFVTLYRVNWLIDKAIHVLHLVAYESLLVLAPFLEMLFTHYRTSLIMESETCFCLWAI